MQTTSRLLALLALLITLAIVPVASHAASVSSHAIAQAPVGGMNNPSPQRDQVTIDNPAFKPLGNTSVQGIIGRVIKFILGMTGVIALVMIIYGGFTWMTSAGNSSKVETAKKTILWSALGIIIIFSAYALVNFVINTLS